MDCNYCRENYCAENTTNFGKEDPNFGSAWVKKFCTYNGPLDNFLIYFPYFILLVGVVLFVVETIFLKTFKAGNKLEKFYSTLGSN